MCVQCLLIPWQTFFEFRIINNSKIEKTKEKMVSEPQREKSYHEKISGLAERNEDIGLRKKEG